MISLSWSGEVLSASIEIIFRLQFFIYLSCTFHLRNYCRVWRLHFLFWRVLSAGVSAEAGAFFLGSRSWTSIFCHNWCAWLLIFVQTTVRGLLVSFDLLFTGSSAFSSNWNLGVTAFDLEDSPESFGQFLQLLGWVIPSASHSLGAKSKSYKYRSRPNRCIYGWRSAVSFLVSWQNLLVIIIYDSVYINNFILLSKRSKDVKWVYIRAICSDRGNNKFGRNLWTRMFERKIWNRRVHLVFNKVFTLLNKSPSLSVSQLLSRAIMNKRKKRARLRLSWHYSGYMRWIWFW